MKKDPTLFLNNNFSRSAFAKCLILTVTCLYFLGSISFAQTPCNQRTIGNVDFKYNGGGAAPARWKVADINPGGLTVDQAAFAYVATGNFSTVNTNFATPNAGNNTTRQYAITANPNTLSPQFANIPTDGMLVINPLQANADQYLTYSMGGLIPNNTYNIEIKVWNVIDMAVPGSGCQQWCNWNGQLYIDMANDQQGAQHANQSNQNWTGTNGSGGWSQGTNNVDNVLKISSGGSYAIITGTMTMPANSSVLNITLAKGGGANATHPVVLGVDYIKVFGCQQEAINVSGGSKNVCEASDVTLTAQGLGSVGSSYSWYQNGTLLPGRNSDTLNVVTPLGPGTTIIYRAVGEWSSKTDTLTSKICCSSVGGTSDEVKRQSFNGLTYTCPSGGPPDGSRHGGYADIPSKGVDNIIDGSYVYAGTGCNSLNDGQYAVVQSSFAGNYWQNRPEVKDHTGLAGSGALFINAKGTVGSVFYQFNLDGLCDDSTRYEFSAWYASLAANGETKPNMEFAVYNGATKVASAVTGVIPVDEKWYEATVVFVTPKTGNPTYTLQVTNLVGNASAGNDLMIDDIVVKKCTPSINLYQNGTKDTVVSTCSSTPIDLKVTTFYDLPLAITGNSAGTVYYQWMSATSPGGPWTNIGTPVTTNTYSAIATATPTYYRAKVSADQARAANGQPPLASDCGNDGMTTSFKLTKGGNFNVPPATGAQAYCTGATMTLTGNSGTGAQWEWRKGASFGSAAVITGYAYSTDVAKKVYSKTFGPADAGIYYFVVKEAGGCEAYDTITVTANTAPTINSASVCMGSTLQISGSGTPAASNPWTSATTSVATVDNTGKVTPVSAGTSVITYTNNSGCSDTATVTVNNLPVIQGTTTVTSGSTSQLSGDGTPASPTAWTSSNTAAATVDNTGKVTGVAAGTSTITYTNSNGCVKTVLITVTDLPTITGNLNVCNGKTTQLTGSGTAATSNPWVSATTSVATVSNTGLVTSVSVGTSKITYTDNNGNSVDATVTVNSLPDISGTLGVGKGATTQLTGTGTPAATAQWKSSNTAIATVDNNGSVTGVADGTTIITYTNNNGCTKDTTVTVSSNPIISGKLSVCVNSTTKLAGTGTPAASNAWQSSNLSVATIDNTGLVSGVSNGTTTITYTDNAGYDTTATVTVNALPTVNGTQNICVGGNTTFTGTGTPAATNPWATSNGAVASINATNGNILGIAAGTSTISYTDNNTCVGTLSITINALPFITGTAGICEGKTTQLTGTPTAAVSNAWVSATPSIATIDNAGLVTGVATGTSVITYANSNGCKKDTTITVNFVPQTPSGTPTHPTCTVTTGSITINTPASGVTYSFDNGNSYQASPTQSNLLPANYQLIAKGIVGGCVSGSSTVTINQPPVVPVEPTITNITQPTCTVATGTITASSVTPNVQYSFDNGATFQSGATSGALTSGVYQVFVKELGGGCLSKTAVSATIDPQPTAPADPQLDITQPTCTNDKGFIRVLNAANNASYSFDGGSTFQTATISNALSQGSYTVIGKSNAGGCLSGSAPATINAPLVIPPAPTVIAGGVVKYCQGVTAQPLSASGTSLTWYNSFNLSIGSTAPTPLTDQGGSTLYYVTSFNGTCESQKTSITVTVNPISANAGASFLAVDEGKSVIIQGKATGNNVTITWTPAIYLNRTDIDTPTVTPLKDKLYTMKVTSTDGCSDTSQVQVIILKTPIIPNAFSPNGDGINDKWVIKNLDGYTNSTVSIFNRYGQLVYETSGLTYGSVAWDGTANGSALPVGTYYYIIKLMDSKKPISGSISIIR